MKTKSLLSIVCLSLATFLFYSCDENSIGNEEAGTFSIIFDHVAGSNGITLQSEGSSIYDLSTTSGQKFNISLLGYYISKIKLEGPNNALYEDEMLVSASATKGYYHVKASVPTSTVITLNNVPAGTYNKVSFTLGVDEDGVEQGAAAGVLDPAEGAWFWNWNAGYIGLAIEGKAEDSPQVGNGTTTQDNGYNFHVGGWKDIPADSTGGNLTFVNNVKHLSFEFGSDIVIGESLDPNAHFELDIIQLLDDAQIDFASQYALHSPIKGKVIADQIPNAFKLDHVHQ